MGSSTQYFYWPWERTFITMLHKSNSFLQYPRFWSHADSEPVTGHPEGTLFSKQGQAAGERCVCVHSNNQNKTHADEKHHIFNVKEFEFKYKN